MQRQDRLMVGSLMLTEFLSSALITLPIPSLERWQRLSGDAVLVGWVITAFLLVSAISSVLCGSFGDLFGRSRMLRAVTLAGLIGSLVAGLAGTLGGVIAGRALQGVAGASQPLAFGLLKSRLDPQSATFNVGLLVAISALGTASGYLLGGILTAYYGPQVMFTAMAAGFALALITLFGFLPADHQREDPIPIDLRGGIVFAPAIACLLVGLGEIGRTSKEMGRALGSIAVGAILLTYWAWREIRIDHPLVHLRLLGRRAPLFGYFAISFAAIGIFQIAQLSTLVLQQPRWTGVGLGFSSAKIGGLIFIVVGLGMTGSLASAFAGSRIGSRSPMIAGLSLALLGVSVGIFLHHSLIETLAVTLTVCLGLSSAYAAIPNIIMSDMPTDRLSEAMGVMAVLRAISMAFGAQILAVILASSHVTCVGCGSFPDARAFTSAFVFMALTAGASLISALLARSNSFTAHGGSKAGPTKHPALTAGQPARRS